MKKNWMLGTLNLGLEKHLSQKQKIDFLLRAADQGLREIDTADSYGLAEELLGRAFANNDKIHIASKVGLRWSRGKFQARPYSEKMIRQSCEDSLRRLRRDFIDLYQLHYEPRSERECDMVIKTLLDLRQEGKIVEFGVSNFSFEGLQKLWRRSRFASVQNILNLYAREDLDSGLLRFCQKKKIRYLAHTPTAGASGVQLIGAQPVLAELAAKYRCSAFVIALAWLFCQPGDSVTVLTGTTKLEHLKKNLKATKIILNSDEMKRLNQFNRLDAMLAQARYQKKI
jgi:aryl-alcohol dehydrogenase-like predicted oxidoreductase